MDQPGKRIGRSEAERKRMEINKRINAELGEQYRAVAALNAEEAAAAAADGEVRAARELMVAADAGEIPAISSADLKSSDDEEDTVMADDDQPAATSLFRKKQKRKSKGARKNAPRFKKVDSLRYTTRGQSNLGMDQADSAEKRARKHPSYSAPRFTPNPLNPRACWFLTNLF
jgi:hypothetical protein